MVTRACCKQKISVKAALKIAQPNQFRYDQPNDALKRKRAENSLVDINRDTNTVEQIHALQSLVLRVLEKEQILAKETSELKKEALELKKLVERGMRPS